MEPDTMTPAKNPSRPRRLTGAGVGASLLLTASLAWGATPASATTPDPRRVDLATPTFTDPTAITNQLFPISEVDQVLQLGEEAGTALRHEITLLPETKVVRWRGQRVETVVSQFVAYGDGEILEVAYDFFAQADDGSVWYFGEDVFNYEDGVVADNDGTWLAGRDGPPGMIMPASPEVGDVYRPENIPGLVFEEVTVQAVDQTVDGPRSPVAGAIRVRERLMDGVLEDKVFAPGYGEFQAEVPSEGELVTVALAVPTDALDGRTPVALRRLSQNAGRVLDAAPSKRWARLGGTVERSERALASLRARTDVPDLLDEQLVDALSTLRDAVEDERVRRTRRASLDLAEASLDLQLRHREVEAVDEDRLEVWEGRLQLDGAAGHWAAVAGDEAAIRAIEHRLDA
ncbi:hypothetical protein BH18ACT1_BH18ACT1_03890 [soil metagenome]